MVLNAEQLAEIGSIEVIDQETPGNAEEVQTGQAPAVSSTSEEGASPAPVEEGATGAAPDANLTATEQVEVDTAHDQFEKTGTWPEDTPKWVQKAVNRATRQKHEEKQRADIALAENAGLKAEIAALKAAPVQVADTPEPSIDDFETEKEYFLALSNWNYDKRDRERAAVSSESSRVSQNEETDADFEGRRAKTFDAGVSKYPDYAAAIGSVPGGIFTRELVDALTLTDNAADVSYHLAKNLPEAERIASMTGPKKAIALGELSAKLSLPVTKRLSNSPDPITPVGGNIVNNGTGAGDDMSSLERILGRK